MSLNDNAIHIQLIVCVTYVQYKYVQYICVVQKFNTRLIDYRDDVCAYTKRETCNTTEYNGISRVISSLGGRIRNI